MLYWQTNHVYKVEIHIKHYVHVCSSLCWLSSRYNEYSCCSTGHAGEHLDFWASSNPSDFGKLRGWNSGYMSWNPCVVLEPSNVSLLPWNFAPFWQRYFLCFYILGNISTRFVVFPSRTVSSISNAKYLQKQKVSWLTCTASQSLRKSCCRKGCINTLGLKVSYVIFNSLS